MKKTKKAAAASKQKKAAFKNKNKISSVKTKAVSAKTPANKAGEMFSKKELSEIEAFLNGRKAELIKNMEDKRNYDLKESEVGDQIDEASNSLDKEILFGSSENERKILEEIESALRRIKNGTYGKCEQCSQPIDKKRVKALPYSRYCIKCQIKNDSYR